VREEKRMHKNLREEVEVMPKRRGFLGEKKGAGMSYTQGSKTLQKKEEGEAFHRRRTRKLELKKGNRATDYKRSN